MQNATTKLIQITLNGESDTRIPEKTYSDLEWDVLQDILAGFAKSDRGYALLENLEPLESEDMIKLRLGHVGEWLAVINEDSEPPVYGIRDIEKAAIHASKHGILEPEDLESIAAQCDIVSRAKRYFSSRLETLPQLNEIASRLDPLQELQIAINRAIEPGGRISDNASPDIRTLRRGVQNAMDRIRSSVDKVLRAEKYEHSLQDDYYSVREDRYVIPVRVGALGAVDGIVHGYSSSGQTAFIEPTELIETNNQLRLSQIKLIDEERRILERLTRIVGDHSALLKTNNEVLAYLDVVGSLARFGQAVNATIPIIGPRIELKSASHPLLYIKLKPSNEEEDNPTVSNDFSLDEARRVLVVSGPNTGGKTVLLKTVGLCSLLAKCGAPIPCADGSTIPLFVNIFTDIGDGQSIEADLSTFSSHLTNIQSFINKCSPRSLVLLDELFSGTDPTQGAALAVSLLQNLAVAKSMTLVTTHLDGLKTLALEDDRFANASMGFDLAGMLPTYEMTPGVPGSSFALRIARRLGFAESIVKDAETYMEKEGSRNLEKVIVRLEAQVEDVKSDRKALRQEREDAQRTVKKFQKKYRDLLAQERSSINVEAKRLREELDSIREALKAELKKAKTADEKTAQSIRETLRSSGERVEKVRKQSEPVHETPKGMEPLTLERLKIGGSYYSNSFSRVGEVVGYQVSGQVSLLLGSLKVSVTIDDLFFAPNSPGRGMSFSQPQQNVSVNAAPQDGPLFQSQSNTVDLRGLQVDDAIEKLELFLDSASLSQTPGVFVIHGHGTGALKRAVRGFLPRANQVEKFRRGERGEGGDGVTIVTIAI